MGLPNILYPPPGERGWREYWYFHFQDHLDIIQAILKQRNVNLTQYVIDPWADTDKDGILERHQQYHNDMNLVLNLPGNDLSDIDFKQGDQVKSWIYLNSMEHTAVHQSLGI